MIIHICNRHQYYFHEFYYCGRGHVAVAMEKCIDILFVGAGVGMIVIFV